MEIGHIELVQYCQTVAAELEERLKRMRALVDYKLRSGTAYSEILRAFLAEHSAGKYDVGEGFIVNPFVKGASSNHCDVLVYDLIQYPLLDVEGDVKVILPRAAAMVVEVERNLTNKRLIAAFENIRSARKVYPYLSGVIFAFSGFEPQVLYECMVDYADNWQAAYAPIAVINVETGFIASRAKLTSEIGGGNSPYEVYELRSADSSAATVFLLLLYFDIQMHGMLAPGCVAKAWKYLLAVSKADFLGKVELAH